MKTISLKDVRPGMCVRVHFNWRQGVEEWRQGEVIDPNTKRKDFYSDGEPCLAPAIRLNVVKRKYSDMNHPRPVGQWSGTSFNYLHRHIAKVELLSASEIKPS